MPRAFTPFTHFRPRGCSLESLALPNHIASLLLRFNLRPAKILNLSRVIKISFSESVSLRKLVVSSAICITFISELPMLIPLISLFFLILIAKISATMINRYADRGHPCLTPLVIIKSSEL